MLALGGSQRCVLRQQGLPCRVIGPKSITAHRGRAGRALCVQAAAHSAPVGGVRARWCLDVRYGRKQEATALLQEWVRTIGSKAGLNASNTAISSGAIGVPESRLEMEVTLGSMAEWEAFLSAVPGQEHLAWSQRLQGMVVDGSPRWEVLRICAVMDGPGTSGSSSAQAPTPGMTTKAAPASQLIFADKVMPEDEALWRTMQQAGDGKGVQPVTSPAYQSPQTDEAPAALEAPILDWKGEPMHINPGDKLPFKFL